ncbi:MAG: DUF305 domain-containing protein [Acidobacteria bacterium]|nr:DUF305 domain-containing protein [Acidobacteriota bacterium]
MALRYLVVLTLGLSAGLPGQKSKPSEGPPGVRAVIVQPGAVGKPAKVLSPAEATKAGRLPTDADIEFMQGMIHHHAQAVEMVDLLRTRGLRKDLLAFGERITISQSDEIDYMKRWLEHYGKPAAPAHDHAAHQAAAAAGIARAGAMGAMPLMPGMLTAQQMAELAAAKDSAFDRLFLTGMIQHHDGALVMVKQLLETPGAGQDPALYDFSTDIDNTQRAEIDLMRRMLNNEPVEAGNKTEAKKAATPAKAAGVYVNARADSRDPRVGLKAGLRDAGQAAMGLQFVATLPKPAGFAPGDAVAQTAPSPPSPTRKERPREPGVQFGTANSDLAFRGNHLFAGNYNGINFYDIDNPGQIKLRTSVLCPGGQGDVSVYGNLLFMSAEAMNGRTDCGTEGNGIPAGYKPPPREKAGEKKDGEPESEDKEPKRPPPPPSPERFRGVRLFDISDLSRPQQVAAVQTCRGSHTHTLVVDKKDKQNVYIYVSGIGSVRQKEELGSCSGGEPEKNPDTALFRIDIIQVPLANPERARIVNSPRIFADAKSGAANALWKGGSHGEGTQKTSKTDKCHDITVYPELGLAAGACSGNGILLDISDPANPKRMDAVTDPNFAFWHSATFNNDGTKVLFTDEWGGGVQPRCRESDPMQWGANAIFTLEKGKMTLASYFKLPASQTETENCVAHNGSLIPVPGRDLMVQAWYQGGISVLDFTDAARPFEVAYFDRGPTDEKKRGTGGHWSAYWYNGYIYGAEIARGVDVLRLVPTEFLTQNEIDASNQVHFDELNVQHQPKITWPSNFIVGRAYVDQLERSGTLSGERTGALRSLMLAAEGSRPDRKRRAELMAAADGLEKGAAGAKTAADGNRMRALAAIFKDRGAARR